MGRDEGHFLGANKGDLASHNGSSESRYPRLSVGWSGLALG